MSCALDMFSLIAKRFSHLLKRTKSFDIYIDDLDDENENNENTNPSQDHRTLSSEDDYDEWRHMFPCIKIFIDWMLCTNNMWQPLPDQLPPDLGPNPDRLKIMANMFNLVQNLLNKIETNLRKKIDSTLITSKTSLNADLVMQLLNRVKLGEDLEVAGFVPLLSISPRADYDYQNRFDTDLLNEFLNNSNLTLDLIEMARVKKRAEKLCLFAEFLCGLEQPILKYDVLNKCYSPIVSYSQMASGGTSQAWVIQKSNSH